MKKILLVGLMCALNANAQSSDNGKLLIVGGALTANNAAVYEGFLSALPAKNSRIAIIPVASGKPSKTANAFKADLVRFGANEENIEIFPLAVVDDSSTEVDESTWQENANNAELVSKLKGVDGFWFTGGDQMHIINTINKDPKTPSALLILLRERLKQGALIGGSSAGAAMMSTTMIAAGDSFSALTSEPSNEYYGMETQERGQLYLHHGLGFFPFGIVDQHFDRKARLGRLAKTLSMNTVKMGYAVDENTAMLVDLKQQSLHVLGTGNVTILNAKNAKSGALAITGLSVSVLAENTHFDLKNNTLIDGAGSLTVGHEYMNETPWQGAGFALPNARLDQILGFELMDNKGANEIRRYSFNEQGNGFVYRFEQTQNSKGYWKTNGTLDQYTVLNVDMHIEPANIKIAK